METDCVLYQISGHTFKNIPVDLFVSYDLSCIFLLIRHKVNWNLFELTLSRQLPKYYNKVACE